MHAPTNPCLLVDLSNSFVFTFCLFKMTVLLFFYYCKSLAVRTYNFSKLTCFMFHSCCSFCYLLNNVVLLYKLFFLLGSRFLLNQNWSFLFLFKLLQQLFNTDIHRNYFFLLLNLFIISFLLRNTL